MPGTEKEIKGKQNWKQLEQMGIIERVDPQAINVWTSPLHLVPKPDGELRACGDFRILNDKTTLDGYCLPNIRHFSAQIKGAKIFSTVD